MADGLDLKVTFRGGKNLATMDWRSQAYLQEVLPWAGQRIKKRVLGTGTTADGRPLPPYSERYTRFLKKSGDSLKPVDYDHTGQMWASLTARVNSKQQGEVGFSGAVKNNWGEVVTTTRRLKSGRRSVRRLTNQMVASILAFRMPGRGLPQNPKGYVPPYAFMELDEAGCQLAVEKYSKYWLSKVQSAPPAIP